MWRMRFVVTNVQFAPMPTRLSLLGGQKTYTPFQGRIWRMRIAAASGQMALGFEAVAHSGFGKQVLGM